MNSYDVTLSSSTHTSQTALELGVNNKSLLNEVEVKIQQLQREIMSREEEVILESLSSHGMRNCRLRNEANERIILATQQIERLRKQVLGLAKAKL